MNDLRGLVALVTGASSGIGQAVAELFASEGISVAVSSVDGPATRAVVDGINSGGGRAIPAIVDVRDAAGLDAAVESVVAHFGRLDILVTSAGIQRYGTVTATTEEVWDEVFAVNVKGVFLATKSCMPHLRRSGHGSVVVVSSVQGTATQTEVVAYTSSKGALNAFTRAVAVDEAVHGVRVNTISPGSVDTPLLRSAAGLFSGTGTSIDETIAQWGASHPLGRVGRPAEIAEAVLFLASPRSSFVTGAEIRVDGGLLAKLGATLPDTTPGG